MPQHQTHTNHLVFLWVFSMDIEKQDRMLAHEEEEAAAYADKMAAQADEEKRVNQECFNPKQSKCLSGCDGCRKPHVDEAGKCKLTGAQVTEENGVVKPCDCFSGCEECVRDSQ